MFDEIKLLLLLLQKNSLTLMQYYFKRNNCEERKTEIKETAQKFDDQLKLVCKNHK